MTEPQFVPGVRTFADAYKGFVIDQWGVLHDGTAPYPGALEALHELKQAGKRVVLLSNSGRRAGLNARRLTNMGFDPADFDGIVTSGEAAWLTLKSRAHPPYSELGRRCYLLTHMGDLDCVADLGLELVDRVEDADFFFASGLDSPPHTLADYRPAVEAAVARDLPMICSNPDIVAVTRDAMVTAPGAVARLYEELGGKVWYIGKPHRPIYQACLNVLEGLQREEIVCIGNSVEHDIKGANDAGLASAFVMGGIHQAGFPDNAAEPAWRHHLDQLSGRYDARADYVIRSFSW